MSFVTFNEHVEQYNANIGMMTILMCGVYLYMYVSSGARVCAFGYEYHTVWRVNFFICWSQIDGVSHRPKQPENVMTLENKHFQYVFMSLADCFFNPLQQLI